ncbi:uncharacterized protein E5676_scaffold105G001260 [Cucumis melo var. makuwa]|uniref:Uncharacterized protein n=1 Tax=Cucumis melo var. makuwa TaxID=1194695 RepID=A0A5A7U409_CUCMM|nr:uncharacterized protein E6C27_scaffold13G001460 [Cucumis melo var. makuwa]TYK07705.1 uncharacterized protein E5676_scaffold105G001260 [Cucumis melo var. makuwa]
MILQESIENLTKEVKESNRAKHREESCASNGFGLKRKGNVGETDITLVFIGGSNTIYINELADEEKVKVAIVSFGQDEVDWFRWSNN